MIRRFFLAALAACLSACANAPSPPPTQAAPTTQWRVQGSEGLDALLLIGAAAGDVLQADEYSAEIAWVRSNFSPSGLAALRRLDDAFRGEHGHLLGPTLVLLFSAGRFDEIEDVMASARNPETLLRPTYESTQYWDADTWVWQSASFPDIQLALTELRRIGFHERWAREWAPLIEAGVARIQAIVAPYDIIPEQSRLLGRPLDPHIGILVLNFSQPYGIRITGQRFLTHYSYDAQTQLHVAAHEIFHPPFDADDASLVSALAPLRADPWMRAIVETHDPAFGYNSFEGVVDEDSTQALDQIVAERMGFAEPARARWLESDGRMHLLAAALYHAMKEDGFDRRGGRYADWLQSALDRGLLSPGEVRRRAADVVGPEAVTYWQGRVALLGR